jgi:hypothetical protein
MTGVSRSLRLIAEDSASLSILYETMLIPAEICSRVSDSVRRYVGESPSLLRRLGATVERGKCSHLSGEFVHTRHVKRAARTKDTVIWSFNDQNCSFYNLN